MIYDCFSFFNELDVLEMRLNILKDVVDKFVLVESVWTHQGSTKELIFEKNKDRFAAFQDRIIHVVVNDAPVLPPQTPKLVAAWARENFQRNAIVRGLIDAKTEDLVMISDLDEIPNPDRIRDCVGRKGVGGFSQLPMRYFLNFRVMDVSSWIGTKILSYADFLSPSTYQGMGPSIAMPEFVNDGPTATRIRMRRPGYIIPNGGWHFGYYGGPDMILRKLSAIVEMSCEKNVPRDKETIMRLMKKGKDPLDRYCGACAVPLDGKFPKYILENQEKYAQGILPCKRISLRGRILFVWMPMKKWFLDMASRYIPKSLRPFCYAVYCRCVKNPIPLMKDQLILQLDPKTKDGV